MSSPDTEESFTSAQAARLLFGVERYEDYVRWQQTIDDERHIQYYGDRGYWELVRGFVKNGPVGELPDPYTFKLFMNSLRLRGKLYPKSREPPATTLAIAKWCRHTIHPGNTCNSVDACSVCLMKQCVTSLGRIWELWVSVGGPHREFSFEERPLYYRIRAIWHVEKVRWANLVDKFEELAELEQEWEDKEMGSSGYTFEEMENVQSCMAAVQSSRAKCPNMPEGADVPFAPMTRAINAPKTSSTLSTLQPTEEVSSSPPFMPDPLQKPSRWETPPQLSSEHPEAPRSSPPSPPSSPSTASSSSPGTVGVGSSEYLPSPPPPPSSSLPATPPPSPVNLKKRVTFSEDIVENGSRPLGELLRISPAYRRGRHSCPSADGWEDTSFKNEPFFPYLDEEDELSEEDEQLAGAAYERVLQWYGAADDGDEADWDMDSDSDSDTSCASDCSTTTLVMGENDGSARQEGQLFKYHKGVQEEFDMMHVSEFDSDTDTDEFDDAEAEKAMLELDPMDLCLPNTNSSAPLVDRTRSDGGTRGGKDLDEDTGEYKDERVLGRRSRQIFERSSFPIVERTQVKRQRRSSI
ncbi:hypothetical protein BU26DRAFT_583303 [Trematosphaeria pertusa]|uniref:Uncharacterized protein n=1 Tax=Trematosphaeria pertusa TaxID=390896 RepID=A0A6A6IZT2_9PLEO|nr:uncharacterized protein BU26DRAFT_583303 [Trematosphaeria pertusa]KAF2254663.1 hypothetical protein BU26DRAFT_583303 [Trematosphaeria pertusa]